MLSYNNDVEFKGRFLIELEAHARADAFLQNFGYGQIAEGTGLDGFRGCSVGCAINSLDRLGQHMTRDTDADYAYDDHGHLASRLGMPEIVWRLNDRIFESISPELALAWPLHFAQAIPVGRDLGQVWPRFSLWLLTDPIYGSRRHVLPNGLAAFDVVVALFRRQAAGETATPEEWQTARRAAYAAPVVSAAYAADAAFAAYAASAADAASAAARAYAASAADAASHGSWFAAAASELIRLLESA